jgi:hypothetical protein
MSEPYTLKKPVNSIVLKALNDDNKFSYNLASAINRSEYFPDDEQFDDWISAMKSGKKIVNPLSPRKELNKFVEKIKNSSMMNKIPTLDFIDQAIQIIAKEHPDVADWLREGENNG